MPLVPCRVCDIGFPAEEIDGHIERMHPEEVNGVGFQKHGEGEILSEPGDNQKVASANWSEKDEKELAAENADTDEKEE